MARNVHIHVAFSCDDNEPTAVVAGKYLEIINFKECPEVEWYLTDLSGRKGKNPGPKGGLSLWGMTGNNTDVSRFCENLRPFWHEVLVKRIGPRDFEHILVFEEQEQSEQAIAYEIFLDEKKELSIVRHKCPFSWRQF